ncbi:MAG: hypothetical protein H7318_13015 [Oligoflexus sp.]|nr:hypothetical protein [Oligoflexus sp.]
MKKLLVASLLVSGVSFAGAKGEDKFKTLDKDADGQVSAEEAAGDSELTAHFATLDKNADGKLSADEFKAAAPAHKGHDAKKAK